MTKPVTFEPGARYVLHGVGYEVLSRLAHGSIVVKNLMSHQKCAQQTSERWKSWQEGTLCFALPGEDNLRKVAGNTLKTSYAFTDLSFLPPDLRGETWTRYRLIQPLVKLPRRERTREAVQTRICEFFTNIEELEQQEEQHFVLGKRVGKGRKQVQEAIARKSAHPLPTKKHSIANPPLQMPHPSTVYRWIRRWERSGGDIRSLVPSYHARGPQEPYRLPLIEELIKKAISEVYLTQERAPVTEVIAKVEELILKANQAKLPAEQLPLPGKMMIYRYLERLDPEEVDIARLGPAEAERIHQQVYRGPRPTRPNQRHELDFAKLDLLVIDQVDRLPIGRPTLAVIRDKFTGYPSGLSISFEPPSYRAAMECMLYAFLPKDYVKQTLRTTNDYLAHGIPEVLVVDNAMEFGRDLEIACLQLGIELQHMPPRKPWFKGSIERWFRTLNQEIIHTIPGTTFSHFLELGDYDPRKHACMTLDALWEALHLWIVDVYTQDRHKGVGGSSRSKGVPAKLWERALEQDFAPRLPPSRNDLLVLLSRNATRTVQHYGIEFETIIYNDNALKPLRSRLNRKRSRDEPDTVQIKYHPGDLSRIWVMDPFSLQYLEIPAVDQEYTRGLSLWKHLVIKRYVHEELKRDVDRTALILAKARLQELVTREFRGARHVRSRAAAARWLDLQVHNWMHEVSVPSTTILPLEDDLVPEFSSPPSTSAPSSGRLESSEPTASLTGGVAEIGIAPPPLLAGVSLAPEGKETEDACAPLPPVEEPPQPLPRPASRRKGRASKTPAADPAEPSLQESPSDLFAQFGIEVSYTTQRKATTHE